MRPLKYGVWTMTLRSRATRRATWLLRLAGGDYPAGYSKGISLTNHTSGKGPQVGQLLAFGTAARHSSHLHGDRGDCERHVHHGHSGSSAGLPRG